MSQMTVRFWGVRGSVPTPGRSTEKYGGNTTCIEVRCEDQLIVFDAGSGLCELSRSWMDEFQNRSLDANLLLTHYHWDHIQGFPFFAPVYKPDTQLTIYGPKRPQGDVKEILSGALHNLYFPVSLSAMEGQLSFRDVPSTFELGPLRVSTYPLPHPGDCLGYRLETDDSVLVLATDCELDQIALNQDEIAKNFRAPRKYDPELIEFMRGADLLIIDTQYSDQQYAMRKGWGHNSVSTTVDLCRQVRPHMLALTHHDPQHDDVIIGTIHQQARMRLERLHVKDTIVFAAREKLTMRVQRPKPKAALPRLHSKQAHRAEANIRSE